VNVAKVADGVKDASDADGALEAAEEADGHEADGVADCALEGDAAEAVDEGDGAEAEAVELSETLSVPDVESDGDGVVDCDSVELVDVVKLPDALGRSVVVRVSVAPPEADAQIVTETVVLTVLDGDVDGEPEPDGDDRDVGVGALPEEEKVGVDTSDVERVGDDAALALCEPLCESESVAVPQPVDERVPEPDCVKETDELVESVDDGVEDRESVPDDERDGLLAEPASDVEGE